MFLNQSNQYTEFYNHFTQTFPTAQLSFIYCADQQQVNTTYNDYLKILTRNKALKNIGFISSNEEFIMPYLTAKANILLNEGWHSFSKATQEMIAKLTSGPQLDREFLDKLGTNLSISERFFVQFFRNIETKKNYVVTDNFLDNKPSIEVRDFLNEFGQFAQSHRTGIIILTTNSDIIKANPKQSFTQIPSLTTSKLSKQA